MKPADLIPVTFVSDTSILADGDVICATAEIPNAVFDSGDASLLTDIIIYDADDQGVALDVVFLRSNVSLGTVNGAPNISDTNALEIIGTKRIATTDYIDFGGARIATLETKLILKALTGTSVYVGLISRGGTPTYTASGLRAMFGVIKR